MLFSNFWWLHQLKTFESDDPRLGLHTLTGKWDVMTQTERAVGSAKHLIIWSAGINAARVRLQDPTRTRRDHRRDHEGGAAGGGAHHTSSDIKTKTLSVLVERAVWAELFQERDLWPEAVWDCLTWGAAGPGQTPGQSCAEASFRHAAHVSTQYSSSDISAN